MIPRVGVGGDGFVKFKDRFKPIKNILNLICWAGWVVGWVVFVKFKDRLSRSKVLLNYTITPTFLKLN